jgi:hypothetical protein
LTGYSPKTIIVIVSRYSSEFCYFDESNSQWLPEHGADGLHCVLRFTHSDNSMEFVSIWMSLKARQNSFKAAFGQVVKDLYFKGKDVELEREDLHLNRVKVMVFRKVVHLNRVEVMVFRKVVVFNANFNNVSVISWRIVLFVEETRVPRENY